MTGHKEPRRRRVKDVMAAAGELTGRPGWPAARLAAHRDAGLGRLVRTAQTASLRHRDAGLRRRHPDLVLRRRDIRSTTAGYAVITTAFQGAFPHSQPRQQQPRGRPRVGRYDRPGHPHRPGHHQRNGT